MRVIQNAKIIYDSDADLDRPIPANPDPHVQLNYWQTRLELIRHILKDTSKSRRCQDLQVQLEIAKAKRNLYLRKTQV